MLSFSSFGSFKFAAGCLMIVTLAACRKAPTTTVTLRDPAGTVLGTFKDVEYSPAGPDQLALHVGSKDAALLESISRANLNKSLDIEVSGVGRHTATVMTPISSGELMFSTR